MLFFLKVSSQIHQFVRVMVFISCSDRVTLAGIVMKRYGIRKIILYWQVISCELCRLFKRVANLRVNLSEFAEVIFGNRGKCVFHYVQVNFTIYFGLVNSISHWIFFTLDLSMAATGPYNYSYIFKYIIIGKCDIFLGKYILDFWGVKIVFILKYVLYIFSTVLIHLMYI